MRVESEEGEGSAFSFPLLIVHGSE